MMTDLLPAWPCIAFSKSAKFPSGKKLHRRGQTLGMCVCVHTFVGLCTNTYLRTIAVNKVTNRWRNHNNKTTKISELNKIIELYEL